MTQEQRVEVEDILRRAVSSLVDDLKGEYFQLSEMDEEAFAFGKHSELARGKELQESHSTLKGVVQRQI